MKFRIDDLKRIIINGKKPKRNVVYKIGYDKFSLGKFLNETKKRITSAENKNRIKKVKNMFKDAIKKI